MTNRTSGDVNLRAVCQSLNVKIIARDANVIVNGETKDVKIAVEVINRMQSRMLSKGFLK